MVGAIKVWRFTLSRFMRSVEGDEGVEGALLSAFEDIEGRSCCPAEALLAGLLLLKPGADRDAA